MRAGCVRARTAGSPWGKQFTLVRVLVRSPSDIYVACLYIFWVPQKQKVQITHDLLRIRISHEISCEHHSRSIQGIAWNFEISKEKNRENISCCTNCFYIWHHAINIFPSIGLSYRKPIFLIQKTPCTSQGKACGCRKLPHDTRRVFLCMRTRTSARASVNTPSLFMCEHSVQTRSVGPAMWAGTRAHASVNAPLQRSFAWFH